MGRNDTLSGHAAALLTIVIWGTTFVSTKVLLVDFTPIEILFIRFLIGFVALIVICPRLLRIKDRKQELYFLAAGLCGITLYYLLENIALLHTTASNVGIIITVAPLFTALLSVRFLHTPKPNIWFWVGFAAALVGVALISYNGVASLELNPLGDFLSFLAALTWAMYSVITRKISEFGYNTIQTTRRTFLYGLLFMIPLLFVMDAKIEPARFVDIQNISNLLFLGLGASALCFVTWNTAVKKLGAVKTSTYIYLVPVITVATSAVILGEAITPLLIVGSGLTIIGLWLSEMKVSRKR